MSPKLFSLAIIVLQGCACVSYALHKDWKHSVYWGAAVLLNLSVTSL